MEMKKLRNTNNKLIDLMGICLSQELLQALELDRHKLEEYVINGTLNSNNLFDNVNNHPEMGATLLVTPDSNNL